MQIVFNNEFKVLFCNAYDALQHHIRLTKCNQCSEYLALGDRDLCDTGKNEIKREMKLQDEPNE